MIQDDPMIQDDIERFARNLREDIVLAEEVRRQQSLDAVLEVARRHGFAITTAAVVDYLCRLAHPSGLSRRGAHPAGLHGPS